MDEFQETQAIFLRFPANTKNSLPSDALTFMSEPPISFLFIPQRNNFYVTYMEKQICAETVKMLKYAIALGIFSRVNDHLIQSVNIKFQLAIMNFRI